MSRTTIPNHRTAAPIISPVFNRLNKSELRFSLSLPNCQRANSLRRATFRKASCDSRRSPPETRNFMTISSCVNGSWSNFSKTFREHHANDFYIGIFLREKVSDKSPFRVLLRRKRMPRRRLGRLFRSVRGPKYDRETAVENPPRFLKNRPANFVVQPRRPSALRTLSSQDAYPTNEHFAGAPQPRLVFARLVDPPIIDGGL